MARKDKLQQLTDDLEQNLDQQKELLALLLPFQEKEKEIRSSIITDMVKKGRKAVSTTSGMVFFITQGRKTFAIKEGMAEKAVNWAIKSFPAILTLSSSKLAKVVKPMLELPEFIEEKVGEPYLTVRQSEEADTN